MQGSIVAMAAKMSEVILTEYGLLGHCNPALYITCMKFLLPVSSNVPSYRRFDMLVRAQGNVVIICLHVTSSFLCVHERGDECFCFKSETRCPWQ